MIFVIFGLLVLLIEAKQAEQWTYKVINQYPHDHGAFTEGLVIDQGKLYEGTGLNGQSSLRLVNLITGQIDKLYPLPERYFGEGITVVGDKIYQLTYETNVGFIYDRETFQLTAGWNYPTQGWGLTHNSTSLILSDGTSTIYFYDIANPTVLQKTITVRDGNQEIGLLNELEYINGEIYANVFTSEYIITIDINTGEVTKWIDLHGLKQPNEEVLNGIAYDHEQLKLYVTGKFWHSLFEIQLIPKD